MKDGGHLLGCYPGCVQHTPHHTTNKSATRVSISHIFPGLIRTTVYKAAQHTAHSTCQQNTACDFGAGRTVQAPLPSKFLGQADGPLAHAFGVPTRFAILSTRWRAQLSPLFSARGGNDINRCAIIPSEGSSGCGAPWHAPRLCACRTPDPTSRGARDRGGWAEPQRTSTWEQRCE